MSSDERNDKASWWPPIFAASSTKRDCRKASGKKSPRSPGRRLTYPRRGRYYFEEPVKPNAVQQERTQQQVIRKVIRQIIRRQRAEAGRIERRGHDRIEFVQPVKVVAEDGREFTLLTRDLSTTGIRIVGTRRLLGQKVQVLIPREDRATPWSFKVRILWTCALGDDLVENGGTFIEVSESRVIRIRR